MLKIRPAQEKDKPEVLNLLKELELYYSSLFFEDFWVAEINNHIAGVLQLKEYPDFFFLGSLGIKQNMQNQGIAIALIKEAIEIARKNIYLYTIMPDFFAKFRFKITTPPSSLPSKDRYECEYCFPDKCVCMAREPHVA